MPALTVRSTCARRARKRNHACDRMMPCAASDSAAARTVEPGGMGTRSNAPTEEQEASRKREREKERRRERKKRARPIADPRTFSLSLLLSFPLPLILSFSHSLFPAVQPLLQQLGGGEPVHIVGSRPPP